MLGALDCAEAKGFCEVEVAGKETLELPIVESALRPMPFPERFRCNASVRLFDDDPEAIPSVTGTDEET